MNETWGYWRTLGHTLKIHTQRLRLRQAVSLVEDGDDPLTIQLFSYMPLKYYKVAWKSLVLADLFIILLINEEL